MKSTELRDWADRPVALSHVTPSARSTKTIAFSASPPLRVRCRKLAPGLTRGQIRLPCLLALSGHRRPTPPLSLCDISPRKGGEGIWAETIFCGVRIPLWSPAAEA